MVTAKKPESIWIRGDLYGPPDPISNLPHIKFVAVADESEAERRLREQRQRIHDWNHRFWADHNSRFNAEKEAFLESLPEKRASADELSTFYKSFLNANHASHMAYNKELYRRNYQVSAFVMFHSTSSSRRSPTEPASTAKKTTRPIPKAVKPRPATRSLKLSPVESPLRLISEQPNSTAFGRSGNTTKKVTLKPAVPVSAAKSNGAVGNSRDLPRQRPSAVLNFHRTVVEHLSESKKSAYILSSKSSDTSSDDSWRAWPARAGRRPLGPPKCRRSASCDSSSSSNLSLADSEGEVQSNTNLSSQEKFTQWLRSKTVTVSLDPMVSNRTWKVNRLAMKRLSPDKCTVRDLRFGLEYVTGIPADLTYLRVSDDEMHDSDNLEKVATNGGLATLCVYSIWQDFVRILFTGNFKNITEAISLHDPNTAPVYSEVFHIMVAHDVNTRKDVSASDVLRQAPSGLDVKSRAELEKATANTQASLELPIYTVVKERNLVTPEMRQDMVSKRMYAALLFAIVNRHKQLLEWIDSQPGIDLNYRYPSGRNLIFLAIFFRNLPRLQKLVAARVDWQTADVTGLTPAAVAARTRDEGMISLFEELEDALDEAEGKKKKKRGKSAKKGEKAAGKSKSKSAKRKAH
ncbi:putative APOPT family protein Y39B6A.34, mitochondrial [Hypsibius exemplaris]|uniref:APOPT family protein Y39B6A.34, mitochondrial n=1 Tax=Hypsibius exemplaris TaxID=2072580 RepID=A0A9X6NGF4_HYPEX|nr:putative APOPT family protein Y39B6A.34, mitochondrial [Hypsibius exemplaris]